MVYKKNQKSKKSIWFRIIITIFIVCFVAVGLFLSSNRQTIQPQSQQGKINYGPPTNEEKQAADSIKDKLIQDQKQEQSSNAVTNRSISVVIVDSSQYGDIIEVRAFVEGLYNNGTCSIKLTKGRLVLEKQSPAFADASTTICTNPEIPRSEFIEPGDWLVIVSFSAPGVSGVSAPQKVIIQ
jgi:hypothetical protein